MERDAYFVPSSPLNTAVLFLIFNRIDTTKKVFESIRMAKPLKLYIAADGAREDKEGEQEKVKAVRDYVIGNIDWDCNVKTLFRDNNLGCGYAPSNAISWFFKNEKMGIILEDDCLPSQSFYWYCQDLLERYKNDIRIWHIGGNNFQKGIGRGKGDYYFSKYNHIWGWASWADRWKSYNFDLNNFPDSTFIKKTFDNNKVRRYWTNVFKMTKNKKNISWWDYQWTFSMWLNNGLAIVPNVNLVTNIGFGSEATHTNDESEFSNMNAGEIVIKRHPEEIVQDKEADDFTSRILFMKKPFLLRVFHKLKKVLKIK